MLRIVAVLMATGLSATLVTADEIDRHASVDASNPWYPDKDFPKLITPQWVGEDGVECVVVLAIDDMRDTAKYEQYLRPILTRLKQIDGRAPISIMTCSVKPQDPQLQSWLEEGLSIECHTVDHPCPLLHGGDFDKAKSTYDRCIDLLNQIPGNKPVAFRTPCCDSLNTVSPRTYAEIFPGKTAAGNYLQIDSSVMNFFTSDDKTIPRELVLDENGRERFWKYKVRNLKRGEIVHDNFVNYIKNYPYPYVINNTCWQFPCVAPSDWSAQHLHGINNPVTVADWKAALDITVHKQGVFNLVFHPHGWITAQQIVELIDHAVQKHGSKVKFLTFREAAARLNQSLTNDRSLREADDSVIAALCHSNVRQTRPGSGDLSGAPPEIRDALQSAGIGLRHPVLRSGDIYDGLFIRDAHVCWINEDTANVPDLMHTMSFDELLAAHRRKEASSKAERNKVAPDAGAARTDEKGGETIPRSLPIDGDRRSDSASVRSFRPTFIGAAVEDITPDYPVRLTGYGNRATESDGVAVKIHARAMAIGGENLPHVKKDESSSPVDQPLAVLITVDNCGVPADVTEAVFEKLSAKHGIMRKRFAICSTHTHSGPWLRDFAPNVLTDLPEEHAAHLKQYETDLIEHLVAVVENAMENRRPGNLSVGRGNVGFAMNRRSLADGRWTGFGEVPGGPVDHQFPILAAHDMDGQLIAVLANYACHATTETGAFNQISGDWPGFAADMIEADNSGAVVLIAIGCGADANPSPRGTHEQASQHGRTVANEVQRMLGSAGDDLLSAIDPRIACSLSRINLPLGPLPSREHWEVQALQTNHAAALAKRFLKMLDDGQPIPTHVPDYPVQTWCFGEDLAMVFLGGEVVVDYSIRLNQMFDDQRLWINAYSNDVPCYVASKRILREGGYEADSSMIYYGHPTRLAPEAEDLICDTVQKLLPHTFYTDSLQASFPGPKTPEESLMSISTRPEFRVELVASEPLINDPVAFDWDVQGRLWVVEMGDYPNAATGGRVQILEDTDNDGRYDKATTFLENLAYPTGISLWRNGAIISGAPDIIYAEDTDGDSQADIRTVLYAGFAEGNQQHRVNSLRWGLDGWLYLANGDSGGEIRPTETTSGELPKVDSPNIRQAISIRGRDLRIHPDHGWIDTLSGQTQFGRERDDFGNWFGNNNSNPIWHYVLEDRYLRRNPHATVATTKASIAEIPGAAPVYPTSRTLARFNDFAASNRFTSACSTSIYRDTLLGSEFYGNAFTCEPVHNLVSRLVLQRNGETFTAHRASDELTSEFFASTDNWTRPVMVRTGPDGAIYIADMYRQVIEHPQWIPAEYQRKLNLLAGHDKGRIYRIVPLAECCGTSQQPSVQDNDTRSVDQPEQNLREFFSHAASEIPIAELVNRLTSPNGWWRDTAQRILLHRGAPESIERIAEMSHSNPSAAVRVQALHTVSQLTAGHAVVQVAMTALRDDHPEVRRTAIRVLETQRTEHQVELPATLLQMVHDPSPAVRQQLACSLGTSDQAAAASALAILLQQDSDSPHIVVAVMSSLTPENVGRVLQQAVAEAEIEDHVLSQLIRQAAAMQKSDAVQRPVHAILQRVSGSGTQNSVASWDAAAEAIRSVRRYPEVETALRNNADVAETLLRVRDMAMHVAGDPEMSGLQRAAALRFTAAAGSPDANGIRDLVKLLNPVNPIEVQQAAAMVAGSSPDATAMVFERWNSITPAVRTSLVTQFLQSSSGTVRLLDALAAQLISPSDIDATSRERMLNHRDQKTQLQARRVLVSTVDTARSRVVDDARTALVNLSGDPASGKVVFEKRCATCHRLQETGKAIGADLAALKDRSTSTLLTAILDPNKAVETKFLSYTAVTGDGLTFSGMLLNETGNSVTLLSTDGKEHVIARHDLEELVCSNRSLMPEGLEKDLSHKDLADVIAFVQSSGVKWKQFAGNSPQLITPNADGSLTLPASAAEIYGPSLVLESKYGNLGWWSSTEDYAVWQIETSESGHWTVEFDYACANEAAGSAIKLSTGTRLLTATVPGTGTWDDYRTWTAGEIDLRRGRGQLIVTAPEQPSTALIDLRTIRLIPPR